MLMLPSLHAEHYDVVLGAAARVTEHCTWNMGRIRNTGCIQKPEQLIFTPILFYTTGADPGFLKGGGVHLRSTSKKRGGGGVQEGVQLWAQC